MVNKSFLISMFILIGLISFVSSTDLLSPVVNGNYSTAFNFSCNTTLNHPISAVLWYNSSGGIANTTLVTVTNTTTNQTLLYNGSVLISSLNDLQTYNFTCQITNTTGFQENSTVITGVTIDNTAPVISLPLYVNGTSKKNTASLTLNISVSDATVGLLNTTNAFCFVNISGTANQTIPLNEGWCNSSSLVLTSLGDGNTTIQVYVNDTVNNMNLNNSFVVQVDTTNPVASAACSPDDLNKGETVTCTCTGTDATSGVASSTATSTPDTETSGTFTYDCIVTDNAGNSNSATDSYTVSSYAGTTTSSSSTTSFWVGTNALSDESFANGFTTTLQAKKRLRVNVENEYHYIGVVEITETTAKVNISSDPIQVILSVGQDAKFDVNEDGYYDIYVLLNSLKGLSANITTQKINEAVPEDVESSVGTEGEVVSNSNSSEEEQGSKEKSNAWIYAVVILIILFIIGIAYLKKKN